jgi:hypothetical protein
MRIVLDTAYRCRSDPFDCEARSHSGQRSGLAPTREVRNSRRIPRSGFVAFVRINCLRPFFGHGWAGQRLL